MSTYQHGAVHRPVPRPARRVDGQDRSVQAAGVGRCLLARRLRSGRCCSASTARSGRRRRSWTSSCGGAPRPRSATTAGWACSSTCSRSMTWRRAKRSGIPRAGCSTTSCATRCASIQKRRGYQEIYTPPLVHQKLWQQSGHWDLYRDNMFLVEADDATYSLKPMNCPESTFIYRSRVRSYREFPLRLSEYGVLHRSELSGVRSGLTRVRHFYTDDAHIYVAPAQIQDEILALMGEVTRVLRLVRPRTDADVRDEAGKGAGRRSHVARDGSDDARGARRRRASSTASRKATAPSTRPRSTSRSRTRSGREWQTATIQVDRLMLPERFDLHYVDENGERKRPVAIHRAILGSLERFIGVITEHFAGAFPFWCAPVQAVVMPIADRHNEAAGRAGRRAAGARASGSRSTTRPTGCRTRSALAQEQKVPYMLVLGDREIEARTAAPRTRGGEQPASGDVGCPGRPTGNGGHGAKAVAWSRRMLATGAAGVVTCRGRLVSWPLLGDC